MKISISSFNNIFAGLRVFWLLLGLVLLGEVGLRLYSFGGEALLHPSNYLPRAVITAGLTVPNEHVERRLRPNADMYFKGAHITINRWGWRGPDISLEKSPGTLRIATLGSSVTMGSGVADDETFSSQLGKILATERRKNVEVINMGVGGYTGHQILRQFELYGRRFKPDMVLVTVEPDSLKLDRPRIRIKPVKVGEPKVYPIYRRLLNNSFLAVALRELFNNHTVELARGQEWAKRDRREKEGGYYSKADMLRDLGAMLKADGVPVMVHVSRYVDLSTAAEIYASDHPLRSYVRSLVDENDNLFLVDTYDDFDGLFTSADRIYPGDRHPNAATHRKYAENIATRLKPLLSQLGL